MSQMAAVVCLAKNSGERGWAGQWGSSGGNHGAAMGRGVSDRTQMASLS